MSFPTIPNNRPIIQILNINNGETVHQRFLLVYGNVNSDLYDKITIQSHDYPETFWPCKKQYFKALIHLSPGANKVQIKASSTQPTITSYLTNEFQYHYVPLYENPALSLVIYTAKDSPLTFDTPPEKRQENTLSVAIEKLRFAGYLWQSFCAEQMERNGFGRRTFRLEEVNIKDTTSSRDPLPIRNTAKVTILRSKQYTLKDIRDVRRAQQNSNNNSNLSSLFDLFINDIKDQMHLFQQQRPTLVAGLILDSHWDTSIQLTVGHSALGGGIDMIRLGIFGSHLLHAWPRSIEQMVDCMTNNTPTDTRYVANDANESGTWFRALNIGMGAMLHEVGHLFTLSHTPIGIMSRGYNHWNRTFMIEEPGRKKIITPNDEGGSKWHRVDIIRLRHHPSFHLPNDPKLTHPLLTGPSFIPLENSQLQIQSESGISLIELWVDGQYLTHLEYTPEDGLSFPTTLIFHLDDIKAGFPHNQHLYISNDNNNYSSIFSFSFGTKKLKLEVTSPNQQTEVLENIESFLKESTIFFPQLPLPVIKSNGLGHCGLNGPKKQDTLLLITKPPIAFIRIYSGSFLDGLEFFFVDGSSSLLGKKGGGPPTNFHLSQGEWITELHVRSGAWVDGISIVTNYHKNSRFCGGQGGSHNILKAPYGYQLVGIYSSSGPWLDQIGIFYQKN